MSLEVCPMTPKEANAFVEQHHRHHKPVVGHKFSIGCTDGMKIVGVAIVGRPEVDLYPAQMKIRWEKEE